MNFIIILGIPIAFDYSCEFSKCINKYRSLSSPMSSDITSLLDPYLPDNWEQNIKGKNYNMVQIEVGDKIGLG